MPPTRPADRPVHSRQSPRDRGLHRHRPRHRLPARGRSARRVCPQLQPDRVRGPPASQSRGCTSSRLPATLEKLAASRPGMSGLLRRRALRPRDAPNHPNPSVHPAAVASVDPWWVETAAHPALAILAARTAAEYRRCDSLQPMHRVRVPVAWLPWLQQCGLRGDRHRHSRCASETPPPPPQGPRRQSTCESAGCPSATSVRRQVLDEHPAPLHAAPILLRLAGPTADRGPRRGYRLKIGMCA